MSAIDVLDLPHSRARALLASGAPVYLPVNPVEYHGPHLSLHNDRWLSHGLIRALQARLVAGGRDWPLLVADDLEVGVDPVAGPGTRVTSYRAARRLVREAARALVALGATRVVFMSFHGSPRHAAALHAGVREVARAGGRALNPLALVLEEMIGMDPASYAPAMAHASQDDRAALLSELPTDIHGGFFETSLALALAPDTVADDLHAVPPCADVVPVGVLEAAARAARGLGRVRLGHELSLAAWSAGWTRLRPFPGYTSRPHLATEASGRFFVDAILDRYEQATVAVLERGAAPPVAPMQWVAVG